MPIAGITTVGVSQNDADQTIIAAIDLESRFDTAYSYGYEGESDRILGKHLRGRRERFTIIGKVGQRWTSGRERIIDGSRKALISDAEQSLRRIGVDEFDLLMLHCPDPNVPLQDSAAAMHELQQRGLCQRVGICNINLQQLCVFQKIVHCDAIQCPLNLLQRESLSELIPHCISTNVEVHAYWTLMKGLLAGKITRDHEFAKVIAAQGIQFSGHARERAHRVVDGMSELGRSRSICCPDRHRLGSFATRNQHGSGRRTHTGPDP